MATLLEQTRALHEETERLERLATAALAKNARSHRDRLLQAQAAGSMIDGISSRAAQLVRRSGRPRLVPHRLTRRAARHVRGRGRRAEGGDCGVGRGRG